MSDVPDVPLPEGSVPNVPDVSLPDEPVPGVCVVSFPDVAVPDLSADVIAEGIEMSEIDPDNITYQLPEVVEESSLNDPNVVI